MTVSAALEPVEPVVSEIIGQHPEVVESVYFGVSPGGRPLAVVRSTGFLTGPELRRACHQQGASAEFDVLLVEEMPANVSERFDASEELGALSVFAAPETDVERALVELWQRLLEFEPVGVLDDFVELGGDSLAALETVITIARTWAVDVDLVQVVDASCVRELAKLVETVS